eukprot:3046242-Rhodomonas_salina.1
MHTHTHTRVKGLGSRLQRDQRVQREKERGSHTHGTELVYGATRSRLTVLKPSVCCYPLTVLSYGATRLLSSCTAWAST